MAEIDFPDTPAIGEVYDQWTWNGELWVLTPPPPPPPDKLGFTFVQDAMPTATRAGDTWWQGLSGASYVWVVDVDSSQWVQFAPAPATTGPVGTIVDYIGTTAPTGWLAMTGQTIASAETFYPALWAVIPASMKSGTSIILPDTRKRVTAGLDPADADFATPGWKGGERTVVLSITQVPADSHELRVNDASNYWPLSGGSGAGVHGYLGRPSVEFPNANGNGANPAIVTTVGGGGADNNLQPYITFLKILRVV